MLDQLDAILLYDEAIDNVLLVAEQTQDVSAIRAAVDEEVRKLLAAGYEGNDDMRAEFVTDVSFEIEDEYGTDFAYLVIHACDEVDE